MLQNLAIRWNRLSDDDNYLNVRYRKLGLSELIFDSEVLRKQRVSLGFWKLFGKGKHVGCFMIRRRFFNPLLDWYPLVASSRT